MLKHILALLILSTAVTLTMSYAQYGIQFLLQAHDWVSQLLTEVFSGGQAGNFARGLLALLSIPVLVAAVPTLAYWGIKRSWFPYMAEIIWVVWLIQAGALMVAASTAS